MQALAAIGQGRLIALWDNLFGQLEQPIAQVLLTRGDISDVRVHCCGLRIYLTFVSEDQVFERSQHVQRTTVTRCCSHRKRK